MSNRDVAIRVVDFGHGCGSAFEAVVWTIR